MPSGPRRNSAKFGKIRHHIGVSSRAGSEPSGIAVGLGSVWVTDSRDDAVYRIDPALGQRSPIKVSVPLAAVAVDQSAGTMWVLAPGNS